MLLQAVSIKALCKKINSFRRRIKPQPWFYQRRLSFRADKFDQSAIGIYTILLVCYNNEALNLIIFLVVSPASQENM